MSTSKDSSKDSTSDKSNKLYVLFNSADLDVLIHDAYLSYNVLVASGYPDRRPLIFECIVWMIRKYMMENHNMKPEELNVKEDHVEGFIDQALDVVLARHSELHGGEKFEDPMDGVKRVDLVDGVSYGYNELFTDVACGAPRF